MRRGLSFPVDLEISDFHSSLSLPALHGAFYEIGRDTDDNGTGTTPFCANRRCRWAVASKKAPNVICKISHSPLSGPVGGGRGAVGIGSGRVVIRLALDVLLIAE